MPCWPWHGFPFVFHHYLEDTPRAFFALGYSVPLSQSQSYNPLCRKRRLSSSAIMQHEVPSPHDSRPRPPVTSKPKHTKEKTNPLGKCFVTTIPGCSDIYFHLKMLPRRHPRVHPHTLALQPKARRAKASHGTSIMNGSKNTFQTRFSGASIL